MTPFKTKLYNHAAVVAAGAVALGQAHPDWSLVGAGVLVLGLSAGALALQIMWDELRYGPRMPEAVARAEQPSNNQGA